MSNYMTLRARLFAGLPEIFWRWNHRRLGSNKAGAELLPAVVSDTFPAGWVEQADISAAFEWVGDFPAPPAVSRS